MSRMKLQPADVVLVSSDGLIGWAIRQMSRKAGERPTRINHAMMSVAGLTANQLKAALPMGEDVARWLGVTDLVVDAQPPKVGLRSLLNQYGPPEVGGTGDSVAVYRAVGLTHGERVAIAQRALRYVGTRYGLSKIVLHLLGLQRFSFIEGRPICSYTVGVPYEEIKGWRFDVEGRAAQPDDIDDYVVLRDDKWKCVHPLGPIKL